jgi:drug/metabolite transporter (DMT)-like permease
MGIVMGNEKLGLSQTMKVAVVCTGVGIASWGDVTLSALGFVLQVASIMADATRCCALQKVMQANHLDAGPLVTLAHVAPFAVAALSLPAVLFEGPRLLNDYAKWSGAIPMVLLSGLLASILNLVVFKIIRLTSALTTSLSGVLKEWACILVAMWVYGTHVTKLQWVGYSIAIGGLLW